MSVFRFEYLLNFWFVIFPCRQTHGAHEPTRPNKIAPKNCEHSFTSNSFKFCMSNARLIDWLINITVFHSGVTIFRLSYMPDYSLYTACGCLYYDVFCLWIVPSTLTIFEKKNKNKTITKDKEKYIISGISCKYNYSPSGYLHRKLCGLT